MIVTGRLYCLLKKVLAVFSGRLFEGNIVGANVADNIRLYNINNHEKLSTKIMIFDFLVLSI